MKVLCGRMLVYMGKSWRGVGAVRAVFEGLCVSNRQVVAEISRQDGLLIWQYDPHFGCREWQQ